MITASRVAVFTDVHGNLTALEAVLSAIDDAAPFDCVIAGGDYCLNGPQPAECLDRVMDRAAVILKGNTDRDIVDEGRSDPDLGDKKRATIAWTREQLGDARVTQLDTLEIDCRIIAPDGSVVLVVHANPLDLDQHIFPDMSETDVHTLTGGIDAVVLVFGHLHIPFSRTVDELRLFNVASVGLPRDGDRRAVWGEFSWDETSGWQGRIHRVVYDYGETVLRILDSGIPLRERRIRDLLRATYD